MRHLGPGLIAFACVFSPAFARHEILTCGTNAETAAETKFLHRQAVRSRLLLPRLAASPQVNRDAGDIAIIDDSGGVVARQNEFNLDLKTLAFTPAAGGGYRYAVGDSGYDGAAASSGVPLVALDDDDARAVDIPFSFPFFGAAYKQAYINSDGNLTFTASDTGSSDRSLGRMTSGPPRISPLFDDLDPSQTAGGVRVLAEAGRLVVSWVSVPEWQTSGIGPRQTFQVRLYPDGRIEFSYSGAKPGNAVAGIAPGALRGGSSILDFRNDASSVYPGAVVERFGNSLSIDIITAAQKFYATHEDAYDYLVIYNNMGIPAAPGAVAYESTVRSSGTGYGAAARADGPLYGSAARLSAVLNLGPLDQYPVDPAAVVSARGPAGDTPVTVLAHETGHLFLAYASVHDPNDPSAKPMLGAQNAHWSFLFNSEASLLEGERIQDLGPGISPRFVTTGTVEAYAPLDQYLMGFRPPSEVPDTFLVQQPLLISTSPNGLANLHPAKGVAFDGTRRDIGMDDIVQAMGRRTPDDTVAQRKFRFGFILVTAAGAQPSAADVAKVDTFRKSFETFYAVAASNRAAADTALRRSMTLSLSPAAGVVAGTSATATIEVASAPDSDLRVQLQVIGGNASVPASVTIPAHTRTASFQCSGMRAGVDELTAVPSDPTYETAFARVQVADGSLLKLETVAGTAGAIEVKLTDGNGLTYPGANIVATASAGSTVDPKTVKTGAGGTAGFVWTPGSASSNQLDLVLEGMPSVSLTLRSGSAVPAISALVNAASFEEGIAAGAIETISGRNFAPGQVSIASNPGHLTLGGVQVLLDGAPLPLLYVSDGQINFYVPPETPLGDAVVTVVTAGGSVSVNVSVRAVQPGIFTNGILRAGTGLSAAAAPVHAGDYLEIYCTGLGPLQLVDGLNITAAAPIVFIGATPVQPLFSGIAPGAASGVYQVNVRVPSGLAPGSQQVILSMSQAHSNEVRITVE